MAKLPAPVVNWQDSRAPARVVQGPAPSVAIGRGPEMENSMRATAFALIAMIAALGSVQASAQEDRPVADSIVTDQPDPKGFDKRGFINNAAGKPCLYTQTYDETNPHFMPQSLRNTTHHDLRTIRFEDHGCMADQIEGMPVAEMVNEYMIAQMISSWFTGTYVLADADYDARNLRAPSAEQVRGDCMVSTRYPSKAVSIEFVREAGSITLVIYAPAFGCGGDRVQ